MSGQGTNSVEIDYPASVSDMGFTLQVESNNFCSRKTVYSVEHLQLARLWAFDPALPNVDLNNGKKPLCAGHIVSFGLSFGDLNLNNNEFAKSLYYKWKINGVVFQEGYGLYQWDVVVPMLTTLAHIEVEISVPSCSTSVSINRTYYISQAVDCGYSIPSPKFTAYPNPASHTLNLVVVETQQAYTYEVRNVLGVLMESSENATGEALSLDVSQWADGLYVLLVVQNGTPQIIQFLVQHGSVAH